MGGMVVKRGGVVEMVMSVTDCGLSGEVDFAVNCGYAGGIEGKNRRGVLSCCG